ncbi:hypothatical protein [Corynebacterium diphtheriae BH8]|uniref:Z1 domain-containing protein n=1 Tax=Corynebacterium diphtheriae TaxID=1717 RepID=UPI000245AECA|nr:Z1 domain-containing protein [Corynebacterium diphtheriae]AEX48517.1 hypothatical protein [Corynebacterium diphtheriae BH8]
MTNPENNNIDIDPFVFEVYCEEFLDKLKLGRDLETTRTRFIACHPSGEDAINAAAQHVADLLKPTQSTVGFLRKKTNRSWYIPTEQDPHWTKLRKSIKADLGDVVKSIDESSTDVLNGISSPHLDDFQSKGLVLGHVQSGKTTNFVSVMAKAADAGYRLIVVLTGINENLRVQTQQRIDGQLLSLNESHWHKLTTEDEDFSGDKNSHLLNKLDMRFIAVVKKNKARLKRLNQWINNSGAADTCPILVIDDEADQASVNVSSHAKAEFSAINQQIRTLLDHQKTAYIAYTATPFANILIDPADKTDLFPKDFIIALNEPDGYFGATKLFGRDYLESETQEGDFIDGLDVIRTVSEEEIEDIRPAGRNETDKEVKGGPALSEALHWFILATAARYERGQDDKHSSMLVHTSMKTSDHDDLFDEVNGLMSKLKRADLKNPELLNAWKEQWLSETSRMPAESLGLRTQSFEQILPFIPRVIDKATVVIDNGCSDNRLTYAESGTVVIAIGGNTLSRGLTLEGLVSSYFVRRSTSYDTLLQMGRWFGFRPGYGDLPRIWMSQELESWFRDLATVEADLRLEINDLMNNMDDPREIQLPIRTHPSMVVTAAAKRQDAVDARVSFSGEKQQTIMFKEHDKEWLTHNLEATKQLISNIKRRGIEESKGLFDNPVFFEVPSDVVIEFLESYNFHEESRLGRQEGELLLKYVQRESDKRRIKRWNVSVITKQSGSSEAVDLGLAQPVNTINRSKLRRSKPGIANIKALTTKIDRINDIERSGKDKEEFRSYVFELLAASPKHADLICKELHEDHVGSSVAHLAIYPIYKKSSPRSASTDESSTRVALDAAETVIGVGIFFPVSDFEDSAIEYISHPVIEVEDDDYTSMDEALAQANSEDEKRIAEQDANL